jgi:hypothetical protein
VTESSVFKPLMAHGPLSFGMMKEVHFGTMKENVNGNSLG